MINDFSLFFKGGSNLPYINFRISPDNPFEITNDLGSDFTSALLTYDLSNDGKSSTESDDNDSVLQPGQLALELGVRRIGGTDFDGFVELGLLGTKLSISMGDGDSFIQSLIDNLDSLDFVIDLILGFAWSQGVYFAGSGQLNIELPIHEKIGPLEIDGATIAIKKGSETLELGPTIKADLGPLKAVVENVGLKMVFDVNTNPPFFHLLEGPTFKPPSGVGLSLDIGVVKGGGYLYFDPDNHEYAGALEFDFANMVVLKAIGLITTRDPFSLLIIITAEFGGGIQLGFGFKLTGVGGLFGLNRTMELKPLMQGVKTGAVDNILFPENPVENAPQIIKDLKTIFPPHDGIFLIGPMAQIGWGSPTLLSISLGIIIEIPGNLAILGVIKLALPDEDAAIIKMQVNFAGAIDFDKGELYFFASLYDSRILFMTLEGDMGLMLSWGDNPTFLMSIGGFHPSYEPPASLPFDISKRLAITILDEKYARIRIEKYFALTSNTVQFGTRAEVFFGFDGFNVGGGLQFDAIFQFDPFQFTTSLSSTLDIEIIGISACSVSVDFTLQGPKPWRVNGTGSIEVLFIEYDVDVSKTWGGSQSDDVDTIDVLKKIKKELEKPDNWSTALPPGARRLTALRKLDAAEADLILHPLGNLIISQKVAPLNLWIDKVGNKRPVLEPIAETPKAISDLVEASSWSKASIAVDSSNFMTAYLPERFALAQYQDMKEAEKLDRPAFEKLDAAIELRPADSLAAADPVVKRTVRYEEIIIDTNVSPAADRPMELVAANGRLFALFLEGNAAARSPLSKRRRGQLRRAGKRITVAEENYVVVNQKTFLGKPFKSKAAALEACRRHPNAANLQVVPAGEYISSLKVE